MSTLDGQKTTDYWVKDSRSWFFTSTLSQ